MLISDLIGQIKGAVSYQLNQQDHERPIAWQRGYGVVSFSRRDLPWIIKYLKEQKRHHRDGTFTHILEQTEDTESRTT